MAECKCHDPLQLATAIVGARIGGIPISWDEAVALAFYVIQKLHGDAQGIDRKGA